MPKEQWEEETIQKFISFLQNSNETTFGISGRDVLVDSGKNYDYEVTDGIGSKYAVELFRLVESEDELGQGRAWGNVTEKLKEEMKNRNLGGFLVNTPIFVYRKKELSSFVVRQADTIEDAIKEDGHNDKFTKNGYEFNKINDLDSVVFSLSSGVRSVNPIDTALKGLIRLLPKKNGQLNVSGHRRILVIVNWAMFVGREDVINALTNINFDEMLNVDEIYYEVQPSDFVQVFNRNVFNAIKDNVLITNKEENELLNKNIRYMLLDKNSQAYDYVKKVTEKSGSYDWFFDQWAKENLIKYAEYRLKDEKSIDESLWVIENFNDDKNPNKDGSNDSDDPDGKHNYHQQLIENEEVRTITTVRGHLCWLMSVVIVQNKPELYPLLIGIIERYLNEDNLYIRSQAIYPLVEFIRRRRATKNQDGSSFDWDKNERLKVRELAFLILRKNVKYPRVMHNVLHLFGYLRDINEKEAEEVINLFLDTKQEYIMRDLAALIVYFAFFRKDDWKEDYVFKPELFIDILNQQIISGDEHLRGSIAWHFWKILEEDHLSYGDVKKYLFLFNDGPYNQHVTSMLALSVEKIIELAPEDATRLFMDIVAKIKSYLDLNPENQHHYINSTEKILPIVARNPDHLLSLILDLITLWKRGVYIGDLKVFFEIYRVVSGDKRDVIKKKLETFYNDIKTTFPALIDVDWSI